MELGWVYEEDHSPVESLDDRLSVYPRRDTQSYALG